MSRDAERTAQPPAGAFWSAEANTQPGPKPAPRRRGLPRLTFPLLLLAVLAGFMLGSELRDRSAFFSPAHPPLEIRSDPPGATAILNGRLIGATPVRILDLKPGDYALRLEKAGCRPVTRRVRVGGHGTEVLEKMLPVETGALRIELEPDGAEVLLDGELAGHTPLYKTGVPAGSHELLVRKTNFEPYLQRISIRPDETAEYKGFALRDKILVMLRRQVDGEPHRVAHYIDLGHYLFVNDDLEDAAETFAKALALAAEPLQLPPELPAEDRQLEERLRLEDTQRLNSEIRKKENWPNKDTALFRAKIEEAQEHIARQHIADWVWIYRTAEEFIRKRKYERAEDLYLQHIAARNGAGDLSAPYSGLLDARLRMHNLSGARETVAKLLADYSRQALVLFRNGTNVFEMRRNFRDQERREVLAMAESLLETAYAASPAREKDRETRSAIAFHWALALIELGQERKAANLFLRDALDTQSATERERRSVEAARLFRRIGDHQAARAAYTELARSANAATRTEAERALRELPAERQ